MKKNCIFLWLFVLALRLSAQSFSSSNLPIIIIDTHGGEIINEPKIEADMYIVDNGPGMRNSITDPPVFEGKIGIEIRGSSSQMFPKKQYGIETWDDQGEGIDVSLLGLPEEEDWVLFAPYNDKSLMRDALAYKLGRDLGRYAPRTKYCEVVLNGAYNGVYVLIEKIKRDGNRVAINKLDPDELEGDDLTGGYIIKVDKTEGDSGPGWESVFPPPGRSGNQTVTFQYEEPKHDEIVPEQKEYIRKFMNEFEHTLAGNQFRDPAFGYTKYIDVNSFVDYFIMNELTKNVDAYRLSTFMYKQRDSDGGKLFMGPIWDYNLGFGNVDYCTSGNPEGFVIYFNSVCPDDFWLIPFWWTRLFDDEAFRDKVVDRWNSLRQGKFKTEAIHAYIDSVADVLEEEAQQRNFEKWPVLNTYVWPNYFVGDSFESEVDWLKGWIADRMEWLDSNIPMLVTSNEQDLGRGGISLSSFPNPFFEQVNFGYTLLRPATVDIELIDFNGRIVDRFRSQDKVSGSSHVSMGGALRSGLYLYRIALDGQVTITGKVFKR